MLGNMVGRNLSTTAIHLAAKQAHNNKNTVKLAVSTDSKNGTINMADKKLTTLIETKMVTNTIDTPMALSKVEMPKKNQKEKPKSFFRNLKEDRKNIMNSKDKQIENMKKG